MKYDLVNTHLRYSVLKNAKNCRACGAIKDLVVHHLTYKNAGNELRGEVILLCRFCHSFLHKFVKGSDPDLSEFTKSFIKANPKFWSITKSSQQKPEVPKKKYNHRNPFSIKALWKKYRETGIGVRI